MRVDNFEEMVEAANAICEFFDDASKRLNLTDDESMLWASAQEVVDNAGFCAPSTGYICEDCAKAAFGQDDSDDLLGEFGEFSPTDEEYVEELVDIRDFMESSHIADTEIRGSDADSKTDNEIAALTQVIAELRAVVKAMISA